MTTRRLFLSAFAVLLLGLMFFDKPFAYLGIGPLFVTELVLVLGLLVAVTGGREELRTGWLRLRRPQLIALLVFLGYEAIRTAFDVPRYRILALRDGVVWGYALFAVVVVTVVGWDTLQRWAGGYRRIVPLFVVWVPIAVWLYAVEPGKLTVPGRAVSLYLFKPGDLLVHLAGAGAAFILWPGTVRGVRRIGGWLVALLWGAGFVMAASLTRGGLLACLAGMAFAALAGSRRQVARLVAGTVTVWIVFGISGLRIEVPKVSQGALYKEASARQLVEQLRSTANQAVRLVLGHGSGTTGAFHWSPPGSAGRQLPAARQSAPSTLTPTSGPAVQHRPAADQASWHSPSSPPTPARRTVPAGGSPTPRPQGSAGVTPPEHTVDRARMGTIRWRLHWWRTIIGYTVHGPYFLTGKGFGINLADSDGFQPRKDHGLRDPHNVFMTFLGRSGVPGLVLFVVLVGTVLWGLALTWWRGDGTRQQLAVWLFVYLVAMLVNASFDVYIENPMGGVWFWSAVGAAMLVTAGGRNGVAEEGAGQEETGAPEHPEGSADR
ncbi:MAG TPA: hypothetical protein ENK19_09255 [Acidobacteria bacterium]|nr:hypothetical protein [Acidobacteriota bacterium]